MENGEKLQSHINAEVKEDIDKLYKHAEIANQEMGAIKIGLEGVSNDMGWLKRFFWVVASSSVGGLITGVINLLIK